MSGSRQKFDMSKRSWFFVPIAMALVVAMILVWRRPEPQRKPLLEVARSLRVLVVPKLDVVPRTIGYGTAQAARIWRAVAELDGRIVETHSELESGAMIRRGETLLKIDATEYELLIAELQAEIQQVRAQVDELQTERTNYARALEIEDQALALAQREFERVKKLHEQGSSPQAELDREAQQVLVQEQKVVTIRNSLDLLPDRLNALNAQIAVKQARLEQAKVDLGKTTLVAPFDIRFGAVHVEEHQFVRVGQDLFDAQGIDAVEIEVHIPVDQGRHLISPDHDVRVPIDMSMLRNMFDVQCIVRARLGDFSTEWKGRFSRIRERIDPQTRTAGVVVVVDDPYGQAIPGERPPLVAGTFCEVELRGMTRANAVVIPRVAIHDDHVYMVGSDNRLRKQAVSVLFSQSSFAVVSDADLTDQILVVSDPTPAIEGMLVDPVHDDALRERLTAEATAQTGLK